MQKNTSSGVKKSSLPVRVMKWTLFQIVSFILAIFLLTVGYAAVTWKDISSGSGASGQPVNQTLVQGIINNMNNLNERINTLTTNLSTLSTRVVAINPTGTNLTAGEASIGGNLTLNGSNTWMFHTPDDGRDQLYFGKGTNGSITTWPYTFNANGTLVSSALQTNSLCLSGDCKTAWPGGSGISQSDSRYYAGACNASKNGSIVWSVSEGERSSGMGGCPAGYTTSSFTDGGYSCFALIQYKCQIIPAFGTWVWTRQ